VVEIVTERLVLRPMREEDLPALVAYRRDPEVARYQTWSTDFSMADAEDMLAGVRKSELGRADDEWVNVAVADRIDGTVHGDCAVRVLANQRATAEVGVTFATASQGRGFAAEAMTALLDTLFANHGMHRVIAETDDRNPRVHRLFERLGFRCEGRLVDADWCKGEWVTLRLFAVLAREWTTPAARQPRTGPPRRSRSPRSPRP
jgi:RimJ/RimL family protein N-acetyltransferase